MTEKDGDSPAGHQGDQKLSKVVLARKNIRLPETPGCFGDYNRNRKKIKEVRKAFHQARIICEQMLVDETISWGHFSALMLKFEDELRKLGDDL